MYIRRLKAGVTRHRNLVLDKQKRFQLSSELAEAVTALCLLCMNCCLVSVVYFAAVSVTG